MFLDESKYGSKEKKMPEDNTNNIDISFAKEISDCSDQQNFNEKPRSVILECRRW